MNFYDSWHFLNDHKMFNNCFIERLNIAVVKVNPETNSIDDDDTKNTKVQIWLEHGPYEFSTIWTHDYDLDCGGDTFEEAIIELANLVKRYYTDDGYKIEEDCNGEDV